MIGKNKKSKADNIKPTLLKVSLVLGIVFTLVWAVGGPYLKIVKNPDTDQYQVVWEGSLASAEYPLGTNSEGEPESGWLSIFLVDYSETIPSYISNNATNFNSSSSLAYADYDNFNEDLTHETNFYFVVRCRFNSTHLMDAGEWTWADAKVSLSVRGLDGDSDFTNTSVYHNVSDSIGGAVRTESDSDEIWMNFWWDDDNDGYAVAEGGTIYVDWIKIEAKF